MAQSLLEFPSLALHYMGLVKVVRKKFVLNNEIIIMMMTMIIILNNMHVERCQRLYRVDKVVQNTLEWPLCVFTPDEQIS